MYKCYTSTIHFVVCILVKDLFTCRRKNAEGSSLKLVCQLSKNWKCPKLPSLKQMLNKQYPHYELLKRSFKNEIDLHDYKWEDCWDNHLQTDICLINNPTACKAVCKTQTEKLVFSKLELEWRVKFKRSLYRVLW